MNNDLISRSALKEELEKYRFAIVGFEGVLFVIDNMPTVEQPTGEWVFRRGDTCVGYYKCNKCGEVERAEKNYCPNCGAKMKGDKEK